jgi:hypothetical protein
MVEFFRAKYPEKRDVFVDGVRMGQTNSRIEIGKGTYTINLGAPRDYRPKWRRPTIENTSPEEPFILTFEKIEGDEN